MKRTLHTLLLVTLTACGTNSFAQGPNTTEATPEIVVYAEPENLPEITTTTTTTTTTTVAPTTVPPPTTSGTVELRCPQYIELALSLGWGTDQIPTLDKVLYRESRCSPDAYNPSDPNGGSYGLMQINGYWCESNKWNPGPAGWLGARIGISGCADLYDPATNLIAGLLIRNEFGWRQWSTV